MILQFYMKNKAKIVKLFTGYCYDKSAPCGR